MVTSRGLQQGGPGPRQIWFLDDLPKGPTGKIQRRTLAALVDE